MYQNFELEKIRKRIDTLDNTIHDLLMERAELIDSILAAKKKNNIQIVQPAREARMIRRLIGRHNGILPRRAIVRIWRELVGAITMLQTGLSVSAWLPKNNYKSWDMARNYFGSILPMRKSSTAADALDDVLSGRVTFAALPYPEDVEEAPWWESLLQDENSDLNIIIGLNNYKEDFIANDSVLIVAKMGFDTSDVDNTFIAIETMQQASVQDVRDIVTATGLTTIAPLSNVSATKFLISVEGYMNILDDKLEALSNNPAIRKALHVGGYPIPIVMGELDKQD